MIAPIGFDETEEQYIARLETEIARQAASQGGSEKPTEEAINSGFFHDGVDETLTLLCRFLGVDPSSVRWDAASETIEGDVSAVIGNIFEVKFGEDWSPKDAK